ncbi:hypothetical protein PM082_019899 [Marasmius tenuissimus]|nr:hypothetical protein PM082_019899 [Marasmius tenuissimus]
MKKWRSCIGTKLPVLSQSACVHTQVLSRLRVYLFGVSFDRCTVCGAPQPYSFLWACGTLLCDAIWLLRNGMDVINLHTLRMHLQHRETRQHRGLSSSTTGVQCGCRLPDSSAGCLIPAHKTEQKEMCLISRFPVKF